MKAHDQLRQHLFFLFQKRMHPLERHELP